MTGHATVPSRQALAEAEALNRELGHENLGFLSEEHGFLPSSPPLLELPPSHRAWDEMVPQLPELHRTLRLRAAFDAMPLLSATADALPDRYLCRASALMCFFAHAYYRVQTTPPAAIPACIQRPWEEISRRLERPAPFLSYTDLPIYNWRMRDPAHPDPMRVENLDLLIPTVGNQEERVFYMAAVELLAQGAPLVGATVRAQEAVARGDTTRLKRELLVVLTRLQELTEVSWLKVDANPHSRNFIDPAVWAKTVAPFALPINEGVQGAAGSSAPVFQLLDIFLGRRRYDSTLGQESIHLRRWYPRHWREFFAAVERVSVRDFVERSDDRSLRGLFQAVVDGFASEKGFLGVHRQKAYGFLRIAHKAGRTVTIGAFGDRFQERPWDRINAELNETRLERYEGLPRYRPFGVSLGGRRDADGAGEQEPGEITALRLDVRGTGIRYRPGDRCGVMPENSDALVDRTLRAMRASGEEPIRLDRAWLEALRTRQGREPEPALPLAHLVRFGKIRPVLREVAKSLCALTASSTLKAIINARAEDQWELWDLLDLLYEGGFETRRLWKAEPWEAESVCNIVPPEDFRLYSISSAMEQGAADGARALDLTVGRLIYQTRDTPTSRAELRHGTASNFVNRAAAGQRAPGEGRPQLALQVVPASRFHLPPDPARPIVMFAAGAGIAPFRSFLQERAGQAGGGENWLFFGARAPEQFHYRAELARLVGEGRLQLRVAFSAADTVARFVRTAGGGAFAFEPGARGRLNVAIEAEENARALWELLRGEEEGGRGAYFYVCGQTGFAVTVMESLRAILARFSAGTDDAARAARARETLYRLAAEGRYNQDIFTTYSGTHAGGKQAFDASDVVMHNSARQGYWLVISGRVYDVSDFMYLHPGGHRLMIENAGTDATRAYRAAQHHRNPEVDAMLGMYEIGPIRRLQFREAWGVAVGPHGLRYIPVEEAFRAWVRFLYLVVDMENALTNDFSTLGRPTTDGEVPGELTPMKFQMIADTHQRFMLNQFATVIGEGLREVWVLTVGLCAPREDLRRFGRELDALADTADARLAHACADVMRELSERSLGLDAGDAEASERLRSLGALIEREDRRFLAEAKRVLRDGRARLRGARGPDGAGGRPAATR